ncbi:SMN interacting spliceosome biogenesis protein [Nitzschia inconspicua]|uniref:SMN interacting spliceosome biogenesis protein n=1 Tax=Nitzschia inconspicua TaxID=303405 RepID=A0A9K3PKD4_9STRA|nr:SMN interacting spliceosome biogenesis protein [Nitzschia inconspicua]
MAKAGQKRPRKEGNEEGDFHHSETVGNETDETEFSFDNVDTMSATEYLAKVAQQAKHMPTVFVSSPDDTLATVVEAGTVTSDPKSSSNSNFTPIDGSAACIAYLFSKRSTLVAAPTQQHLPRDLSLFTTTTMTNFQRLRDYLEQCQQQGIGGKQTQRQPVPPMKCRDSWFTFCCGNAVDASSNESKKEENTKSDAGMITTPSQNETESGRDHLPISNDNSTNTNTPSQPWKENLPNDGFVPTVKLLLQMDQVMVRRVLSHLAYFFHAQLRATSAAGPIKLLEWIYALLARLEKPVHREDAAILFGLLKDLCFARSLIDGNGVMVETALKPLNVLILLIGVYFEQGGGMSTVMATANEKEDVESTS